MSLAYRNGRFVATTELTLSFADAGFVEGAAVTDFARTHRGKLFRWPDHCDRFERDGATLGIIVPETRAEQTAAALHLLNVNHPGGADAAVIRFATPGPLRRMDATLTEAELRPTFGMHTIPLPAERYAHITAGAALRIAGMHPSGNVPVSVKHRSRLAWRMAEQAVPPGSVAVLLDEHGRPDTAVAAVLAVVGEAVVRPPAGTVLESVSFLVVRDLCAVLGIEFREGDFDLRNPGTFDALLLAGTGFGLAAAASLDGRPLPISPIVERLIDAAVF